MTCRACGSTELTRVLDLGNMPAADQFPQASEPVSAQELAHELAMSLCGSCGLVQLADDDTITSEPRGIEPLALREQAVDAVQRVAEAGLLRGATVREFGSPHGGSWLPLLAERGFAESSGDGEVADVVLDSFGVMHDADQRAGFALRAKVTAPDGVLLVQFPSLMTMVNQAQWNALRHGHFGYYSLTALSELLGAVGMSVVTVWEFDLYGGTFLAAAVHGHAEADERVADILRREKEFGVTDPAVLGRLQDAVDRHVAQLREWLLEQAENGRTVYGYGAGSRVTALLNIAEVNSTLLKGIADGSPAKQGRRIAGTDVAIISPEQLIAADPDRVLLTLPDLYDEVRQAYPQFEGRWWVDRGAMGNQ